METERTEIANPEAMQGVFLRLSAVVHTRPVASWGTEWDPQCGNIRVPKFKDVYTVQPDSHTVQVSNIVSYQAAPMGGVSIATRDGKSAHIAECADDLDAAIIANGGKIVKVGQGQSLAQISPSARSFRPA